MQVSPSKARAQVDDVQVSPSKARAQVDDWPISLHTESAAQTVASDDQDLPPQLSFSDNCIAEDEAPLLLALSDENSLSLPLS